MSDRNELAEDRTHWAEDRTSLANERTFAGWMRTGMAAIGVAIGLKAVFGAFEPTWMAKAVASIFLAAIKTPRYFLIVAIVMALGALGTGVILWSL